MILAWTGDELSHGHAQNGVNFDFEVKFDLEVKGQSPPKAIGILTKVLYIHGPNLVILVETGDELSWLTRDWHTDGHTHRQTQATTIPEGQNWPWVKMKPVSCWATIVLLSRNLRQVLCPVLCQVKPVKSSNAWRRRAPETLFAWPLRKGQYRGHVFVWILNKRLN